MFESTTEVIRMEIKGTIHTFYFHIPRSTGLIIMTVGPIKEL